VIQTRSAPGDVGDGGAQPIAVVHDVGCGATPITGALSSRLFGLLFEIVDVHGGEGVRSVLAGGDAGNFVGCRRSGNRKKPPGAAAHPSRLNIHVPVNGVTMLSVGKQIGRHALALGIGATMTRNFAAADAKGGHQFVRVGAPSRRWRAQWRAGSAGRRCLECLMRHCAIVLTVTPVVTA
jgi:hypothetical protein